MKAKKELPVWRSLLFVPVNVDRFVKKAHTRGADAIQLDLEDSIPPSEKDSARSKVQEAAKLVSRGGADVVVRINRPWRLAMKDLEAVVSPLVNALALPKVDSADHVRFVDEVVSELELERGMEVGSTKFIVMVETARAFFRAEEIARATDRVVALTLGAEDFALSVGMLPQPEALLYPKMRILIAARSAGVLPLGIVGTIAEYDDPEAFRKVVRRSRKLGFVGASAIHPNQVPILNEEFSPTEAEVGYARRVIAAYEEAQATGRGSTSVDGKMIDAPIVERAKMVLRLHEAIRRREARAQLSDA